MEGLICTTKVGFARRTARGRLSGRGARRVWEGAKNKAATEVRGGKFFVRAINDLFSGFKREFGLNFPGFYPGILLSFSDWILDLLCFSVWI